ncbi:uncharacterized protein EAF01_001036 [Botrytis porri]|uniref:Uncharacterized protein n=1 Tax=Botrytis porri TaxID=87229 RepID=A0A4Z1KSW7_9HELO|nr:uncharacterized protein EAF01_001036 [Botrytis porri]KAF7914630.1 hypothetical protein EAF01_001036 [Botrytis porri]TGO86485.1 hypothetical protein BPOR_0299g00010 [Botrytis porri]
MYLLATTLVTISLYTSLVTSGPLQSLEPRNKADGCTAPVNCWSLYMRWDMDPKAERKDFALVLMRKPKDLEIVDRDCNIVKNSMEQPDPNGPITVKMEGKNPSDLIITGATGYGKPVFKYNNVEYGRDDCGWKTGPDWSSYNCHFLFND